MAFSKRFWIAATLLGVAVAMATPNICASNTSWQICALPAIRSITRYRRYLFDRIDRIRRINRPHCIDF